MSTPMPTAPQPVATQPQPQPQPQESEAVAAPRPVSGVSRLKKILMSAIMIGGLIFIFYSLKDQFIAWFTGSTSGPNENMEGKRTLGGILGFGKSGDPTMEVQKPATGTAEKQPKPFDAREGETEDSLLTLVERAKKAGLTLQGVTQCIWSKRQREMFGDRNSKARKVLESIYIECRTRDMCPGITGYPTWVYSDKKFPGFKSPTDLRALVHRVEQMQPRPMLQDSSEPIDEVNIPDAKHAVKSGNPGWTPEMMKKISKK